MLPAVAFRQGVIFLVPLLLRHGPLSLRSHCHESQSRTTYHIFIFYLRTIGQISTKLGIKYYWVKGIQDCSNEGPRSFQSEDKNEISKIHNQNLIVFLRNHCAILNQTKNPCVNGMEFKFVQMTGQTLFYGLKEIQL